MNEHRHGGRVEPDPVTDQIQKRFEELAKSAKSPEEIAAWQAKEKNEQRIKAFRARLEDANIPPLYAGCKIQTDGRFGQWNKGLQLIKERLASGFIIGLVGGRGPGKSQMGAELVKYVCSTGWGARFEEFEDLLGLIKRSFNQNPDRNDEDEVDLVDRYGRYELLVIDEVSMAPETEWSHRILFRILNRRYTRKVDTLLISCQEPAQFDKMVGPSIVSRIQEKGFLMHCDWGSFREKPVEGVTP